MLKNLVNNQMFHITVLVFIAVFTFLPTLEMSFYLDEWGNLYDFTHKEYKFSVFTAQTFYSLYQLFGTNPTGYFAVGIGAFALSVIAFYFLVSRLLGKNLLGFIAGAIYATTPVGTNTVMMVWTYVVEGGYPFNLVLIGLFFILLLYFIKRNLVYFLAVFFMFWFFLEFEPRRAFIILPILIFFDYFINFKKIIPDFRFITRSLTLIVAFIGYYKYNVTLSGLLTGSLTFYESPTPYDWQTKLNLGIESLTHLKPHITSMNILLGGPWVFISGRLGQYINPNDETQIYLLTLFTLALVIVIIVLAFKVKKRLGLLLLFSLSWMYTNIYGIYIFSSPGISDTVHRTLSIAAPGDALFYTVSGFVLYTFLRDKNKKFAKHANKIFITLFIILVGINFFATRYNFEKFNNFRSRPAHAFFNDLKKFYPQLPKNCLLYFQTPNDPHIKYRLSRIYGGSPYGAGSAITTFYPELSLEEIKIVNELSEVEKFVNDDSTKIDRVFAFYFDENGLSNITDKTRVQLRSNK